MGISGTYESANQEGFVWSDFTRHLRQYISIISFDHVRPITRPDLRPYEFSEADTRRLDARLDKLISDYYKKEEELESTEKVKETLVKQTKQVAKTKQIPIICHKSTRKRKQKKYNRREGKNKEWRH